ncbi:MAG: hypothetical protein PHT75_04115 [Bacilli bacterium]|nr:hypothetical protein [Bacilli bacterium]
MGESFNIVKQFKVNNILLNGGSLVKLEKSLINELDKLKIPYNFGAADDSIEINSYLFYILNPGGNTNENDNSLVLCFELLNIQFLSTGDISTKIEEKLINEYSALNANILKVSHHGSITSNSELILNFIKPKYAIIQVGLNNQFNHPSDIVIDRLSKRNIKTFKTSINGNIKIIIRANAITVIPFKT